ncbi:MAG TPA: amino acid deaminase [Alphaproteobacteria bacterium]|nr:amino acid deaminase [Alphaproteobacteria bacterium]
MIDLSAIENEIIDSRYKGYPTNAAPSTPKEVGRLKWNVLRQDLPFPLAVLKESALDHNQAWMRDFTAECGVFLAPHGKTTMSPQLFARQLAGGAWGITVATVNQLGICVRFGLRRIIMANQLIGRRDILAVIELLNRHADLDFAFLLDSEAQFEILAALAEAKGLQRPFTVLLEIGIAGGRTGCRSETEALTLARRVAASRHIRLVGIECYEGLTVTGKSDEDVPRVAALLDTVKAVALACDREGLFAASEIILSAGGSAAFDIVARELPTRLSRPVRTVLRSGCYFTHDTGIYERMLGPIRARSGAKWQERPGLRPALEIWSQVQSRPEPGLAILTMGRRDVSYDIELPKPIAWFRLGTSSTPNAAEASWRIGKLNDQHAYLEFSGGDGPRVGDLVACGISHPCTTFDKWQLLWLVDDDYTIKSAIRTFF